jgi:hypothetical protein
VSIIPEDDNTPETPNWIVRRPSGQTLTPEQQVAVQTIQELAAGVVAAGQQIQAAIETNAAILASAQQAVIDAQALLDTIQDNTGTISTGLSTHIANKNNPHEVTKAQVGLGNVDNTSDANKPLSGAQSAALGAKADATVLAAHIGNSSNPHAVTKAQVGLGSVDNVSDANKPVSTAQAAAIGLKADTSTLAAHTGNVNNPHGTTKAQVGLGNVDNVSDANKPVSTAQAAAIALKADTTALAAHTGNLSNPHGTTKAQVGLGNVDNTSDVNKPVSTAQLAAIALKADNSQTIEGVTQPLGAHIASRRLRSSYEMVAYDLFANGQAAAQTAFNNFVYSTPNKKRLILPPKVDNWQTLGLNSVQNMELFAEGTQVTIKNPVPASGLIEARWTDANGVVHAPVSGVDYTFAGLFDFNNNINLTFSGDLVIDCPDVQLGHTQGQIIAVAATTFDFQVSPGFRTDFTSSDGFFTVDAFGLCDGCNGNIVPVTLISPGILRVGKDPNASATLYTAQKWGALLFRKYATGLIGGYTNRDIQWIGDWTTYYSTSLATWINGSQGDNDWSGFNIKIKPNSNRYLSSHADGHHHLNQNSGTLRIVRSVSEGMCDDCINVHGGMFPVASVSGNLLTGKDANTPAYIAVGHQVQITDTDGRVQGYAYVNQVTLGAYNTDGSTKTPWAVLLDVAPPAGMAANWKICDIDVVPKETIIEDNDLGKNWGNGTAIQVRGFKWNYNRVKLALFHAVVIAQSGPFNEGPLGSYGTINDNKADGCARVLTTDVQANIVVVNTTISGALASYYDLYSISILRNHIRNSLAGGIYASGVNGLSLDDNVFEAICQNALGQAPGSPRTLHIALGYVINLSSMKGNRDLSGNGKISALNGTLSGAGIGDNPGMVVTGLTRKGDFGGMASAGTNAATATPTTNRTNRVNGAVSGGGVCLPKASDWGSDPITYACIGTYPVIVYAYPGDYFDLTYPASYTIQPNTSLTFRTSGPSSWIPIH